MKNPKLVERLIKYIKTRRLTKALHKMETERISIRAACWSDANSEYVDDYKLAVSAYLSVYVSTINSKYTVKSAWKSQSPSWPSLAVNAILFASTVDLYLVNITYCLEKMDKEAVKKIIKEKYEKSKIN